MTRPAGLALALALAGCAPASAPLPEAPVPAGPGVALEVRAVPLNPDAPAQTRIGRFAYAGGIAVSSKATSRLHGLSDLAVRGDRLVAVSDEGDLFEARLTFDRAGRLAGLAEARISALSGPDGKPLQGKEWGDAEGLAMLPNGDRLVSFEQRHRILRYPAAGGAPVAAPTPEAAFAANGAMEALAAHPGVGPDAYLVGGEDSGQLWLCRLSDGCEAQPAAAKPDLFGLVGLAMTPIGLRVQLERAFDPIRGNRIGVTILGAKGERVDRLELARPFTVDNFEGLAAVDRGRGVTRFYLVSDDNFQASQRTLLIAFDWTAP